MNRLLAMLTGLVLFAGCGKPEEVKPPVEEDTTVRFNIQDCEGMQRFEVGEQRTYDVDWYGIGRVQQSVPQGWEAVFSKETGKLTITAPQTLSNAAETGRIEFIAKGEGGEMFTPAVLVHLNGVVKLKIFGPGAEGTTSGSALNFREARDDDEIEIEGSHEVFLDISPDVFNVVDNQSRNYFLNADGTVVQRDGTSELPEGLCRLRVNLKTMKWERVSINAVRYSLIGFPVAETPAEYLGRGCWIIHNAPLEAKDGNYDLRYRFEVDSSDPAALKYWCATWDSNSAKPTSYVLAYQNIRQTGNSFDTSDGSKGRWYFMDSDRGKWASITICMNQDDGRSVYTQQLSFRTFADHPVCAFMGDSITARWGRASTGHPQFFTDHSFLNAGISGNTTTDMLSRFNADVVQFAPKAVVICAGTNDIAQNDGYISNPDIMANIASMCGMASMAGIKVIMCSLLPANRYGWRTSIKNPEVLIKDLNARIQAYCTEKGYPFVDFWTPFADQSDGLPQEYSSDGVHPNQGCYTLMENIILPVINSVVNE